MMDFNRHLGLRSGEPGAPVILDTRPEHQAAPDAVHFAVLATIAEVAAASAVGAPVVPATVSVHLLARARPGRLVGRGSVLRRGRRLAVAEGSVYQGEDLVAKAVVSFAVIAAAPEAGEA